MKILSFISVLIFSVISTESYGISASIRPTLNGHTDEDCSSRSQNGGASNLQEVNCMLNPESCMHNATWTEGRIDLRELNPNNEMDEKLRGAMATVNIAGAKDHTQAVQVCEGVYVTNAHGLMSESFTPSSEDPIHMVSYPYSRENAMKAIDFISPRLDGTDLDGALSQDKTTDFMFVKVRESLNPEDVVRPVRATSSELQPFNQNNQMAFYRPPHAFTKETERNGVAVPNFDSPRREISEALQLYDAPLRAYGCNYNISSSSTNNFILTNCPAESRVSGSPFTVESNGDVYLAGIHSRAGNDYEVQAGTTAIDNYMQSEAFCDYYEREDVCGQPCASTQDLQLEESSL